MKKSKKGISPLIATVLLIAFTIAIGGVLLIWFSSLTNTQTQTVGTSSEKLADCAASAITIREARYNSTPGSAASTFVNVTISLVAGTQNIANLTVFVTGKGITNSTADNSTITPGSTITIRANVSSNAIPPEFVRASGICQSTVPIIAECKTGQACLIAV